jgi:hypothetical protein
MATLCCQICEWGLLKRKQCNIYVKGTTGAQILNFQNTFDRPCDEIRIEIQTENFFRNLISPRLMYMTEPAPP